MPQTRKPKAATAATRAKAKPKASAKADDELDPSSDSGALDSDGDGDRDDDRDAASDDGDGERREITTPGAADSSPDIDGADESGMGEGSDGGDGADAEIPARATAITRSSGGSAEKFDALAVYLREVQRHPLLTPEETNALAVKFVTSGDQAAAARLVTSNLRLVVKIAYEYRRAYRNIMDLVQEGNIGLMQAVKRYDPYRGVKLSSYAAWWIRAYILRFILNNWRLVKLGTTQAQRKLFFNLRKKKAELIAMGIDPTDAEIAKQLNVPESDVAEMDVRLAASEKSLDAPVGDSEGRSIAKIDMMPAGGEGPEALMADGELQAMLKEKLANFRKTLVGKEKDIAIFDERLVSEDPLTLQELGDRFGISRERVRQLEQRLTGHLREYLRAEMGEATEVS